MAGPPLHPEVRSTDVHWPDVRRWETQKFEAWHDAPANTDSCGVPHCTPETAPHAHPHDAGSAESWSFPSKTGIDEKALSHGGGVMVPS